MAPPLPDPSAQSDRLAGASAGTPVQPSANTPAEHVTELLEVAQSLGDIGVWECDLPRMLAWHWSRRTFALVGMAPVQPAPDLDTWSRRAHPDDNVSGIFMRSITEPGEHEMRFRITGDDGIVRHLHARWRVAAGSDGQPVRAMGILRDDSEAARLVRSVAETRVQLTLATDLAGVGVWRHDLRSNLMHYNDRAFALFGMQPRPEGMTLEEVRSWIHPDDLVQVTASAARTLATGEPSDAEARYRHADGSWRHVLMRRVLERAPDGSPLAFLGVGIDVTAERERTRRSSELARRLGAATRAARVGIWTTTVDTSETHWNEQMYELFDRDPARGPPSLSEWLEECIHPDDRESTRSRAAAYLVRGDERLEVELRTAPRNGVVRWVVLRADVDREAPGQRRLIGVALDVTEQHIALDALRAAAERAALVHRSVGIGVWEQDLRTGQAQWDESMWRLRGLAPRMQAPTDEERLGMLVPEDREPMRDQVRRVIGSGRLAVYEFRVQWPDGQVRWLASRSIPVLDELGREVRRLGVNWDVTDARLAESAQRERLVAMRESQAKSRFLARMSHELRTPLNAVLGFTQLMQAEGDADEPGQRRRRLAHVRSAGEHLLSLINDVLDLSRLEGGEMKLDLGAVSLAPLVAEALPLVEPAAREAGLTLLAERVDARPRADATRLRQVLLNLLSNAVKYNRPGGWVRIEAHSTPGVNGSPGQVRIRVADNGRGMSAEQLHHIFEPFNRLGIEKEGIEGTGIGLAIVKALVERMGGEISVQSHPQAGTVFEMTLPAAADDEPRTIPGPLEPACAIAPETAPSRMGSVLYIEDNPVNLLIVEELLARRPGLRLTTAVDGHSGVAEARRLRPDLILIDMQLPDIDGDEVLAWLRRDPATASIPCIALSANAMPADIDRALRLGFADYWTKPLDFRGFLAAIDTLFGPAGAA